MNEKARLLEAHVQFELDRWTGTGLADSIEEEVTALFAWFESVRLDDVLAPEQVSEWIHRSVDAEPPSPQLLETVTACLRGAYDVLLQEAAGLGELLSRRTYQQVVDVVVGLRDLRPAIVRQITRSSVYSQLIAHVLYQGIKSYLITENVFARRIPGASSLFRLGQNALNSAAPGLEKGIDKQLVAFINTNIQDTILGSGAYLVKMLDDAMVATLAEELRATNVDLPVGEAAALMTGSSLEEAVQAAADAYGQLSQTPLVHDLVTRTVAEFFGTHGQDPLAAVLDNLGVTPELVADRLAVVAAPLVAQARSSGYLEARIRNRLDAFYTSYFAAAKPDPPRRAPRKRSAPKREG